MNESTIGAPPNQNGSLENEIVASICIPTFERYGYLSNLLGALRLLDFDDACYEILIVDNSNDGDAKSEFYGRSSFAPNVRILNSSPQGASRAKNVGLEAARGRYILFIDDDTEPTPSWLREIVTVFENYPDAVGVGGPIVLIWPEDRPKWIPRRYECYLSSLDHGQTLKQLDDNEYLVGANMGFRTQTLREFGGFPTDLGRRRHILLSNEEFKLQHDMRTAGCAMYYTPHGLLYHNVHRDRLDQGWFRRRIAWQSVSDALCGTGLADTEECLAKAVEAGAKLGIDSSFIRCFTHSNDPDIIAGQMQFLERFMRAALLSHAKLAPNGNEAVQSRPQYPGPLQSTAVTRKNPARRAAIKLKPGGTVFVEATPMHEHLYDSCGPPQNSTLLTRSIEPYANNPSEAGQLLDFLDCAIATARDNDAKLFLVTLDYWLRQPVYDAFIARLRECAGDKFAMLHVVPTTEKEARMLQEAARSLDRIIVLSPDMEYDLKSRFGVPNVAYLPHPALIESYPSPPRAEIRRQLSIPEGRIVFSNVGEVRRGKGLDLLIEAMTFLSPAARHKVFFLFGGKSTIETAEAVSAALQANDVLGRVHLRQVADHYAGLTDLEYADFIRASDVGLLLYQDSQRVRMSGILPNYVMAGTHVITTANSYCGRLVATMGLGQVLVTETPQELAFAIEEAIELAASRTFSPALQGFAAEICRQSVCERLSALISGSATARIVNPSTENHVRSAESQ